MNLRPPSSPPPFLVGLVGVKGSGKSTVAELFAARGVTVLDTDRIAREVIEANPKPVADFHGGKASALQFLVGQVMRASKGKANPNLVNEMVREKLASQKGIGK